jgi:acyl dehydratase
MPGIAHGTLRAFAEASGDRNPLHLNTEAARSAGYDDVLAHGMLIAAYAGRVAEQRFPGRRIRSFRVRFTNVTHVGDVIGLSMRPGFADPADEHYGIIACDQNGEIKLRSDVGLTASFV